MMNETPDVMPGCVNNLTLPAAAHQLDAPRDLASLAKKMASVMASLTRVRKGGRNDFHKYDYATESDITDMVRQAMAEQGVAVFVSVLSAKSEPIENSRRAEKLTTVELDVTYVCGETGASYSTRWQGQGTDSGDKGYYKAYTGAMKYALSKTFLLSFGDDPEQEEPEATPTKSSAPKRPSSKKSTPPAPKRKTPGGTKFASPGDASQAIIERLSTIACEVAAKEEPTDEERQFIKADALQEEWSDLLCKRLDVASLKHATVKDLTPIHTWLDAPTANVLKRLDNLREDLQNMTPSTP